jgi:uncharacterized membrane protein YoaK (UPF0700 family)
MASSSPASRRAPLAIPVLLAFLAGAVDACTFLALFGLFVAQLTGSFITVGVQVVKHDPAALIHLLALPLFFVAGAAIALLAHAVPSRGLALSLAIEVVLLVAFMVTGLEAGPFANAGTPSALLAGTLGLTAMGVQSATVRLMLPGAASTNVMTVNTTQLAIDVAQWLIATFRAPGAEAGAAAARRIAALGPIMLGFFAGSVFGAVGFTQLGFWSLLPLIGVLLGLLGWVHRAAWHASGRSVG